MTRARVSTPRAIHNAPRGRLRARTLPLNASADQSHRSMPPGCAIRSTTAKKHSPAQISGPLAETVADANTTIGVAATTNPLRASAFLRPRTSSQAARAMSAMHSRATPRRASNSAVRASLASQVSKPDGK